MVCRFPLATMQFSRCRRNEAETPPKWAGSRPRHLFISTPYICVKTISGRHRRPTLSAHRHEHDRSATAATAKVRLDDTGSARGYRRASRCCEVLRDKLYRAPRALSIRARDVQDHLVAPRTECVMNDRRPSCPVPRRRTRQRPDRGSGAPDWTPSHGAAHGPRPRAAPSSTAPADGRGPRWSARSSLRHPRSRDSSRSARTGEARSRDRAGRDWTQVVANGGVAAITALAYGFTGSSLYLAAGAGAVAVAAADTWATEIGRFSRAEPRIVTTWRRVPHGVSGGITGVGVLAACAGAALIAVVGAAFAAPPAARFAAAVAIAGCLRIAGRQRPRSDHRAAVALDRQQYCELRGDGLGSGRGSVLDPVTREDLRGTTSPGSARPK